MLLEFVLGAGFALSVASAAGLEAVRALALEHRWHRQIGGWGNGADGVAGIARSTGCGNVVDRRVHMNKLRPKDPGTGLRGYKVAQGEEAARGHRAESMQTLGRSTLSIASQGPLSGRMPRLL